MPASSTEYCRPEAEARNFLASFIENTLVANFANKNRHTRTARELTCHLVDGAGIGFAVGVSCLQHVEVEYSRVFDAVARGLRGVNCYAVMIGVSTSNITGHLGPGGLLRGRVAGLIGGKVVGHCALARETPNHRRSEEHTSELQSHSDLVCRLLLEKKKQIQK